MDNTHAPAYRQARRQVERKLGFWLHLAVYLCVNTGLVALNLAQHHGKPWALGPLLGWGIGLLFHGLSVWLRPPSAWKQRLIAKEMERL